MGRPLGSKNRWTKSGDISDSTITEENEKVEVIENGLQREEEIKEKEVILKSNVNKLGEGQAYFEAPDGSILIGDAVHDRLWYRAGNNGRGMWINKKR